jgi:hypothetical protein
MINEPFYQEYLSTNRRIELPSNEVPELARPMTTTLDIFADILQGLIKAGAIVEGITEVDEEDEEGDEVLVEAGISEVWAMIKGELVLCHGRALCTSSSAAQSGDIPPHLGLQPQRDL